jgi:hypothetical protein
MSRQIGIRDETQLSCVHMQNVIRTHAEDNKLTGRHICADVAILLQPHMKLEDLLTCLSLHLRNIQTFVARWQQLMVCTVICQLPIYVSLQNAHIMTKNILHINFTACYVMLCNSPEDKCHSTSNKYRQSSANIRLNNAVSLQHQQISLTTDSDSLSFCEQLTDNRWLDTATYLLVVSPSYIV